MARRPEKIRKSDSGAFPEIFQLISSGRYSFRDMEFLGAPARGEKKVCAMSPSCFDNGLSASVGFFIL